MTTVGSSVAETPLVNKASATRRPDNVFFRDVNTGKYLALNAVQTFALDIFLYPLDVVKTRLQVQNRTKAKFTDMFRMFRCLVGKEGIRGLYHGLVPSVCGGYPGHAMYFVAFEWSRNYFDQLLFKKFNCKQHLYFDIGVSAAAGLTAEAVSGLLWVPGDIITQRLQIRTLAGFGNPHHQGAIDIVKSISAAEGFRGFYRGYLPSLYIYAPGSAIWWGVYEFFKNRVHLICDLIGLEQKIHYDAVVHLFSGCFAGFVSSVMLNPLEVARTRFQVIEPTSKANIDLIQRGFLRLLLNLAKNEGVNGLYRGFLPRILVSVPGTALSVVAYEFVKRLCVESNNLDKEKTAR